MNRRMIGWITMMAGALLVLGSMATQPTANASPVPTSELALHNDTAETGTDCPADGAAYWHFVLAPNNGGWAFVEIALNLDGTTVTFSGGQIVPNGTQTDNVFVAVPAGYALDDLLADGSSALVTPEVPLDDHGDPTVSFVLSHLCDGTVPTTTTTTTTSTSTTLPEEESTTTTSTTTSTTLPEEESTTTTSTSTSTTLPEESTTTTEPEENLSTTTTESESQNPTTTTISESLPPTGSNGSPLMVLGLMAMAFGIVSVALGRTPDES